MRHAILKTPLILLGFMLLGFFLPNTTLADSPADVACKECHTNTTETLTLPSGDTIQLGIFTDDLSTSAHGVHATESVACNDCHRNETNYRYPHVENLAQNRVEFEADVVDSCTQCHVSVARHNPGHLQYLDNPNLPTCTDCHGAGHTIASVEGLTIDPVVTCQSCHESYDDPAVAKLHEEVVANFQADQTCRTCHTDAPIYPAQEKCLTCHNMLSRERTFPSGESIPLHVDTEAIEQSVHGAHQNGELDYPTVRCQECHADDTFNEFPHDAIQAEDIRNYKFEMSNLCRDCHPGVSDLQADSTHAAAHAEGNNEAATCVDCHGGHAIQPPAEPREHISRTCAQCHDEISAEYETSVHGEALLGEQNPDVPVCIDCHGVHNIADPTTAVFRLNSPLMCAECHADEALMGNYDISPHVFDTYVSDFHGTTLQLFEENPDTPPRQAVCFDCHGVHNIKRVDDTESGIAIKENMQDVCAQCHEGASVRFPDAWLGHYEPSKDEYQVVYYTELFFSILTVTVLSALLAHIGLDFSRLIIKKVRH